MERPSGEAYFDFHLLETSAAHHHLHLLQSFNPQPALFNWTLVSLRATTATDAKSSYQYSSFQK